MKMYKKHILISLFLIIGLFIFTTDKVDANINWYGVQVECIYSDGGAYTFSYIQTGTDDNGDATYKSSINRTTYNLVGTSNLESATSSSDSYVTSPVTGSTHQCKTNLRVGSAIIDEDDETTRTYYKFGSSVDNTEFKSGNIDDGVGFWKAIFTSLRSSSDIADEANDNSDDYTLVSERYILTSLAGDPDYTLTYKSASDQATGSDSYAYVMVYSVSDTENIYLLKTKDRTTRLVGDTSHFEGITVNSDGEVTGIEDEDTIYLNSPEPTATTDSTGVVAYSFNYGQIRYAVSTSESSTYSKKYVLFNTGLGSDDVPDSELCDSIMPETSKVLKRIIGYIQILVPILMIVLCAIDIGKIVISGNLDEELPKQRKKIIGRLVVGIIIFFLPLIMSIIINMLQDSGLVEAESIKEISCLFE